MLNNWKEIRLFVITICALSLFVFLGFNRHSKTGYFNYRSQLWADKAGYYVYLPATFIYGYDTSGWPDSLDIKTGDGFHIDKASDKIITKYSCGVAILQLPFFLGAYLLSVRNENSGDGFNPIFHKAIDVAGAFYLTLGLLLIGLILIRKFNNTIALIVTLTLVGCTNLYYYGIDETGMSHIYSFALFASFLYLIFVTDFMRHNNVLSYTIFGILAGLMVLVRPTNVIFLSVYLFLELGPGETLSMRCLRLLNTKGFFLILVSFFATISPQLIYWEYAFSELLSYSYQNEGFNWFHPKIINIWFSPNNGLFLYTPIYLILMGCQIGIIKSNGWKMAYTFILFIIISYVFSAWWDWSFGCSFGSRNFVEYLAIFCFPLAEYMYSSGRTVKFYWLIIFTLLAVLNLKMIYTYDECFFGLSDWDFERFVHLIIGPTK
ncbi:MAG: hypothetical protein IPN15_08610 [Saprospiraceae bacterium]|nr:hypothetical protein [Candidatus Vicinibacter affinis]